MFQLTPDIHKWFSSWQTVPVLQQRRVINHNVKTCHKTFHLLHSFNHRLGWQWRSQCPGCSHPELQPPTFSPEIRFEQLLQTALQHSSYLIMGREEVFRSDLEMKHAEAFTKSLPDARHRNLFCTWEVQPSWRSGRSCQGMKRGNGKGQHQWDRLDASVEKRSGGVWVCFPWESWDEACLCIAKVIIQLYQNHDCMVKD